MISVIVPIYNRGRYIAKCIESLISQTYKKLEIIIIDDGSDDDGGEICLKYAAENDRIIFIRQENGGVSAARNAGLRIAQGEWIAFCDSDDYMESDMLELLLSAAIEYKADIVQCGVIMEYENGNYVTAYSPEHRMTAEGLGRADTDFLKHLGKYVHSKLFSRKLLEGMSFNTEYSVGEDFVFSVKAALAAKKIVLENKPKYHYVQHDGSACYSAPTVATLANWRNAPAEILKMISGNDVLRLYYLNELLRADFDICSRYARFRPDNAKTLLAEVREELRKNLRHILTDGNFGIKEKIKALLISFAWRIYTFVIYVKKGRHLGVE